MDQDRFNGLGHAVAANLVGSKAGHNSDEDSTKDRNQNRNPVQFVLRRRNVAPAEALEVEQVCGRIDQVQQRPRKRRASQSKQHGKSAEHDHARAGVEVAQLGTRCHVGTAHWAVPFRRRAGVARDV